VCFFAERRNFDFTERLSKPQILNWWIIYETSDYRWKINYSESCDYGQ
jgi:hypothetical protein